MIAAFRRACSSFMAAFHHIRIKNTNCFLLRGDTTAALIDTGPPGQEHTVLAGIEAASVPRADLKLIIITHAHYDHLGSAVGLSRLTGARIAMHEADASRAASGKSILPKAANVTAQILRPFYLCKAALANFEPVKPDLFLEDGQSLTRFGIDASVYHTPGHTPGSITIVSNRCAFAGDLVLGVKGASAPAFAHNRERLHNSITKLRRLGLETVYPSHGAPFSAEKLFDELQVRLSGW